jgi:hypothetical protein
LSQRDTTEADFDFTVDILSAFFAQSRIRRSLATIADVEVTGWEKWWQVELAMFLCDHDQISEWDIEEEFLTDRRRGVTKDFVAADISFRRKKHATDRLIILELKQGTDWKRCVANMLRDAEKMHTTQLRSLSGAAVRSFFVVGVYPSVDKAEIHDYIEELAEAREIEWDLMETRFIKDTPFSFTIL